MSVFFGYFLLHLHGLLSMTCLAQKVPNLYVFGDSAVEYGFKTHHETGMKAGYRPYGIECVWLGEDRFTNGKTLPEIIASSFKVSPPVQIDDAWIHPEYGVNYASASAGILTETGSALGKNYCMEKQVSFFKETVENVLRPKFQSTDKLSEYLSNSIYLINIGSSDYIFNYLQHDKYNSSRQYNGKEFAELLTRKLGTCLKDLYNLGARKMVIFQIGPLGCFPYIINRLRPKTRCAEGVNKLVSIFNDKLNGKLKELSEKLHGSTFVTAKTFDLIRSMIQKPSDYGFEDTRWSCCPAQGNEMGLCDKIIFDEASPAEIAKYSLTREKKFRNFERVIRVTENFRNFERMVQCLDLPPIKSNRSGIGKPRGDVCDYRKLYLFWDELHLTEDAYKVIAYKCLASSNSICSPSNILPYLVQLNNEVNEQDWYLPSTSVPST